MTDKIPKGWEKVKLGEIAKRITSGGTPSTKNTEYYNGNIPWLNTKEIRNCRIYKTEKYISQKGFENSSAKWVEKNSVIVAMYGATAGKVAINKIPLTTNQACCNITLDAKKANYNFIYYFLLNSFEKLNLLTSGAAQQNLNVGVIKNLIILLPPLPEQRAIAEVLSSLDDKIDLLHRQNKTLEKMAETLYENWISGLKFNSTLRDIIYVQNGFAFKSKSFKDSGYHKVIKIKNISGGIVDIDSTDFISEDVISKIDKRFKIDTGDVLFAMTGAKIGKMGIIPKTNNSLWLNQRVGLFKEKFKGGRFLAYLHLKSDLGIDYIENTATGSAQPNISSVTIENCEFPKLSKQQLIKYSKQLEHLFNKIIFNLGQIRTLENLRDTLLPKLMSGQVRVKY